MAIRIREWGVLSYPGRGVQVPLQGIATMDESAARLGRVIEGTAQLGARLAEQQETVTTAGSLAEFADRLRLIEEEDRAEIDMQNVRDWAYAWKQASEPRLAEAMAELPPEARAAAGRLAAAYNAQASMCAQRDYELGRIGLARHRWQSRVDDAVKRGDAEEAERWLKAGKGLFVPEHEMEQKTQRARSESVLNGWRAAFADNAVEALAALRQADARLPQVAADAELLQQVRDEQFRAVSCEMAEEMGKSVQMGVLPSRMLCEKAAASGVLTERQATEALQQSTAGCESAVCRWNCRIDECPDDKEAAVRLQLDMLSAPLPIAERSRLLQRLRRNMATPVSGRSRVSRCLWQWYESGRFGCPGDAEALQQLARLQELSHAVVVRSDHAEDLSRWLKSVCPAEDKWICFNNN